MKTLELDLEIELKDLDVGAEWLQGLLDDYNENNKEVENCIEFLYAARTALMEEKIKEAEKENAK